MNPKVSIIVPVFNCETYISKCLDSIISQTYFNIEILIINGGSVDRTEEIIKEFQEIDQRIRYFYQSNSGPSVARNVGIDKAKGEYITFVDADDTIDPYYVEYLVNEIITLKCDLVCCGYKDISIYGSIDHTDFNFEKTNSIHYMMEMVCEGTGGVLWGKIYKKEIIDKNKLRMDKDIYMNEDLVFVLQYVSHCKSFSTINRNLYNYNRLNEESISANINILYVNNLISVCLLIEKIFEEVNFSVQQTNKVIIKKVQDFIITVIEQQSKSIRNVGIEAVVANVKKIIQTQYIETKIDEFSTKSKLYKPYIFLLKRRLILASIFYGIFISNSKRIRNRLVGR